MSDFSFISNAHPNYIESLYDKYQEDPDMVEASWRHFFKGYEYAGQGNGHPEGATALSPEQIKQELRVLALIFGYRNRGHLLSTTNPLKPRKDRHPMLDLKDFNLSEKELDTVFVAGEEIGLKNATLRQIIERLKYVYCGNIGFQFQHIQDREKRRWIRSRVEKLQTENGFGFSQEKKRRILEKLNGAVVFEEFLHTKFLGQKRFSLEGGESTIVALDGIINSAVDGGVEEVVIGMAHRGRLNVLANTLGKTYEQIFSEFEGDMPENLSFGDGDVKYHLGYSSQVTTHSNKSVYLKLVPNPSHLEAVDPVVEGFARAKADILYNSNYDKILPILIHGDAAIAGQGVVYEVAQMSKLKGYYTGGTVHFVINNQIGFTTDFDDARSSVYCTGVASTIQAPVFHVNGDDPEAVQFISELAIAYRQEFNSDIFIDMVCYRKHGHNEGDDPEYTQPEMYKFIKEHKNPRELYSEKLIERGDLDKELADEMEEDFRKLLQDRLDEVKEHELDYEYQESELAWKQLKRPSEIKPEDFDESPETGIDRAQLDKILQHLTTVPDNFHPLPKFNRLLKSAKKKIEEGNLDWALGELSAYASILMEGRDVRMSGQDVKRGTFSHRHSVLHDAETYEELNRLNNIQEEQGQFRIFNSLLSEFGVLGFEYGYSMASPDSLVIWEAQFGDFYNGAQTIVDQFITAGESKWHRMSGLVMLLPHGYEGQGPEHSSARLERFLQNCAEYNLTVANVTKPANFFHLMRRQLARPFRKPLVVMSPKSLLRHPKCVSDLADFEAGTRFHEVYDDAGVKDAKKVKRVLFCSGKIYYDLLEEQENSKRDDVAIVRLEQLYPFPEKQLEPIFKKYAKAEWFWVQEEPANMGAWQHIKRFCPDHDFTLISRKASASPATGFKKKHDKEQAELVEKSFA